MKQRYTIYALFLLSLFVSISASAQIKGVITDSLTNEPLMYITVQYEGKGVGGISNANGEYQVETRKGWDELTFSAVGYITTTSESMMSSDCSLTFSTRVPGFSFTFLVI